MSPRLDAAGLAALVRPRIGVLVLMSTAAGYFLQRPDAYGPLPWTLLGTLLVASAGCALNHYLERDADARMPRTAKRPLVTGALSPARVLVTGVLVAVAGLLSLLLGAGPVPALIELLALIIYLGVYTPLKRRTSVNTWVGAVPGALPVLAGAAAAGGPGQLAWIAFTLIFLWQLPHFFAIASMYREQYASGGMKMLSGDDPDDALLRWQMPMQVMSVMLVSILPVLLGPARMLYAATALLVGSGFLLAAFAFRNHPDRVRARRVVVASVVYLPLVLTALVVDVACGEHHDHAENGDEGLAECCELDEEGALAVVGDADDGDLEHLQELWASQAPPEIDDGTGLPNYGSLPDFELQSEDGEDFSRTDLLGHVWIVDFIFTSCAHTCPPMSQRYVQLMDEGLPVRFLSVTVDPARDTPEVLTAYRTRFVEGKRDDWRLITGEPKAIQMLAEGGFKLPVNAGTEVVAGMPPMFHSGKFALVDSQGRVRGYYDYRDELQVDALRADVGKLAGVGS